MESTAVFIANKESLKDPVKKEKISDMVVLIKRCGRSKKKITHICKCE